MFFCAGPLDHGSVESPDVRRKTAARTPKVSQTEDGGVGNFAGHSMWGEMSGGAGSLEQSLV